VSSRNRERLSLRAFAALALAAAFGWIGYQARGRDMDALTARIAELEATRRTPREAAPRALAAPAAPARPPFDVGAGEPAAAYLTGLRPALNPTTPDRPERERHEAERRRYFQDLDRIVANGAPSDWRPEPSIVSALSSIVRIEELRCADDLCRVEVSHTSEDEQPQLADKIASLAPFSAGTLYDPDAANKRTVLYVARPDVGFPEL